MTLPSTPTALAVSPDSGEHWTVEGAWEVSDGVHRIPLPLPMDGLRAVNVYVITTDDGLVLIDGGWAIPQAREVLQRGLRSIGAGLGDISRFLATRMHRDHFTMATVLGHELGVDVALGLEERPGLDVFHRDFESVTEDPFVPQLVSAGATDLAEQWNLRRLEQGFPDLAIWRYPDTWIEGDQAIIVGDRFIDAVHTPGHTPGHFVFAERQAGLLFAGDHVLPTITPSIGFIIPPAPQPLGDFMTSLAKVRGLPDLQVLPAHGPVGASTHARVDELLQHHESRLVQCLAAMSGDPITAADVAGQHGWTRHQRTYRDLDYLNGGMAAMETMAHLDLLVARGTASRRMGVDGAVWYTTRRPDDAVLL